LLQLGDLLSAELTEFVFVGLREGTFNLELGEFLVWLGELIEDLVA